MQLSVNLYTSYTGRKMEDENFVAYHTRRKSFFRIKKALSGISEKVLYTSLRELEEAEILVREVEQEQKPSIIRYYLAEEYAEVKEMVRAAHSFAEKYVRKNEIRQCGDLQKVRYCRKKKNCV